MALGFGWRSDNRRSSLTFRGIVEVAGDEGLGRIFGRARREKSTGGYGVGAGGCRATSGDSVDDWASTNQVSNFVIAPDDHLSGFD